MTELEERILKKNIPGKYSTWNHDQDDDDDRLNHNNNTNDDDDDDDDGNENDNDDERDCSTIQLQNHHYYNYDRTHNKTGVKGVLADYKQAKEIDKIRYTQEQLQQEELIRRITQGSTLKDGETSFSLASILQQQKCQREKKLHDNDDGDVDDDFDNDVDDDFDNDDFLQNYRQMRLTELQNNAIPIYGTVKELSNAIEFSQVIDDTDPRVYCIFHLYNDQVKSCHLFNTYMNKLAENMNRCRFFKLEAYTIQPDFDPIGFPCVLIYKGGKEVANLTPITLLFNKSSSNRLEANFTFEDVTNVLEGFCSFE